MPTEAQVERLLKRSEPPIKPNVSPYALPTPARIVIAGASGSGKTRAWIKYLCSYGVTQWDAVFWCSPTRSLSPGKLDVMKRCWKKHFVTVPCDDGRLNVELLDQHLAHARAQGWEVLVRFDDLLAACKSTQRSLTCTSAGTTARYRPAPSVSRSLAGTGPCGPTRRRFGSSASPNDGMQFAELAKRLTSSKDRASSWRRRLTTSSPATTTDPC